MPNLKFTKPWHGVPRESIDWHPIVDPLLCIGCGTCVTGCSRLVYRFDFQNNKSVVYDPLNCLVGCTTCANVCPSGAISFPSNEAIRALQETPELHDYIWHELNDRKAELALPGTENFPGEGTPYIVEKMEKLQNDIILLILKPEGNKKINYTAGQYIAIEVPDSEGMTRDYSIGSAPKEDGSIELHIRHVRGGKFTTYVFEKMKEGETLNIFGPFGEFRFHYEKDVPVIMAAVSTGLAPFKALLEEAFEKKVRNPIKLYLCAHNAGSFYGMDWLKKWKKEHPNFDYYISLSSPDPNSDWKGLVGRVHNVIAQNETNLKGYDSYVAGSPKVIKAVIEVFQNLGMKNERIFYDIAG